MYGKMSREEADSVLLKSGIIGGFVIRQSSQKHGDYVLSVLFAGKSTISSIQVCM